jgi:deazaflavin-dependent oxidoreductase (nitroreductase family)
MPLPQVVARTNRYWINPIARTIGPRVPPFLLLHHKGRKSRKAYTTPVWAFRQPDGFLIVLTYGPRTDWLRNLQAAGTCTATYRGQTWHLTDPQVRHGDPTAQQLPWLVSRFVRAIGVEDILHVTATPV